MGNAVIFAVQKSSPDELSHHQVFLGGHRKKVGEKQRRHLHVSSAGKELIWKALEIMSLVNLILRHCGTF